MNWAKILHRWSMRSIHGAILGAALLGSSSAVWAQSSSTTSATTAPKNYAKSQSFELPVRMDPEFRSQLSKIVLYVRAPGGPWSKQQEGPPDLTKFQCHVPHDGEYWYTLVTVDRQGRATPADVNLEPPSQRVIVDTTPPAIQVQSGNSQNGDLCLKCTVLDANPDHTTLKAVCRTDQGNISLEMVPGEPGSFRIKGPEMLRFPVLVSAMDLAKNIAYREVNLRDMIGAVPPPAPAKTPNDPVPPPVRPEVVKVQSPAPAPTPVPAPTTTFDPAPPPRKVEPTPPPRTEIPPANVANPRGDFPPQPINSAPNIPTPPANEGPIRTASLPIEMPKTGACPFELINTTVASVKYRIDQVGPSGVGKVEIYMTPDNGQTWHRLVEQAAKQSPADVQLPGDGIYGIRIVVTNGNGFGGKTPLRGDTPHCMIEVDTTSPFVQFRSSEVLPSSGHVEIRWNATDKNLGSEPVTLSYRTRQDGPWQVIARNVKNDGAYRWAFPRDAGGQFFFKIEVADKAGNLAQDVSRQPCLIDTSEPLATVVGVSGGTPRP